MVVLAVLMIWSPAEIIGVFISHCYSPSRAWLVFITLWILWWLDPTLDLVI